MMLYNKNNRSMYWIVAVFIVFNFMRTAWANPNEMSSQALQVSVHKNQFVIKQQGRTLVRVQRILFNQEPVLDWQLDQSDANQWQFSAVLPARVDYYHTPQDQAPRPVKLSIRRVDNGLRFFASPAWGRQVSLELGYLGDDYFGINAQIAADQAKTLTLNGQSVGVDVYSEEAQMRENYASAFSSLFISSLGYGAFFDTLARGHYQFAQNNITHIQQDTGTLDWYLWPGKNVAEIHQAYYKVVGSPKKVPIWALGPVGWRDQNNGGAAEIVQDVQKLAQLKMPFTAWFVDRPYAEGAHAWSKMNFAPNFAQPQQWIKILKDNYGLEFMTWTSTAFFGDKPFAKHLDGKFTYLDISHPDALAQYQQKLQQEQYAVGVKGHKIDRSDEGFPLYEDWHQPTPLSFKRNTYALGVAKMHHDALQKAWQQDQFTFARSAIHRSQPYLSAVWGGDPRTSWDGLQTNLINGLKTSLMGFPVWGTDVGGYQGEGFIPDELWIRWLQLGSVTGFFEIKWDGAGGQGRDRMPWQYSPQTQALIKQTLDDRMVWLPYYFSLANQSEHLGAMMQPMVYRHLNDKIAASLWDQFYLGDAVLVAPVVEPTKRRKVYLPEGQWRSWDAPGEFYQGGRWVNLSVDLKTLPRFIKHNSLFITLADPLNVTPAWRQEMARADLALHVFPADDIAENTWHYVDGFDAQKIKPFALKTNKKSIVIELSPLLQTLKIIVVLKAKPSQCLLNEQAVACAYDGQQKQLIIHTAPKEASRVEIIL